MLLEKNLDQTTFDWKKYPFKKNGFIKTVEDLYKQTKATSLTRAISTPILTACFVSLVSI